MPTTRPTRPVCRTGLLALTGLLLWPLLSALPIPVPTPGTAFAQERPMTPTLLRRLAEAVDGHRTGNLTYAVAEWQFPNRVLGAWDTRAAAVADSSRLATALEGPELGLFVLRAPVDTLWELPGVEAPFPGPRPIPQIHVVTGCKHDRRTSVMREPWGARLEWIAAVAICPQERVPWDAISSITMAYVLTSGDTLTRPVPLWADALFFSPPALDKFVFPYYGKIVGMREAMRMRNQILRDVIR